MRVLFVSHRFPYPPTFGSKVRAFQVIRHLAQQHDVSVLSLVRDAREAREAQGLAALGHDCTALRVRSPLQALKIAATLLTPVSASEAFFHSAALQREIDRRLSSRSYDFVFVHCSAMGRYFGPELPLPGVIDYCDVDSLKWRDFAAHKPWPLSWGYRWEAWRLARAERRLAARFGSVTLATPGEAAAMAAAAPQAPIDWFANGVDAQTFSPAGGAYDPDLISFVGRMDYFPNVQCMLDFCTSVWPALKRRRPALRLQIVGADPTAAVRRLVAIDGVSVTGAVPDVRDYVRRSALTIAPLRIARGTQNKILESMAMQVPVVASRLAAGGVAAESGEHLLVGDTPDELCDAIERIVGDPLERRRLAEAGRARVLSHHAWSPSMQRLDGIIDRCRGRFEATRPSWAARPA